MLQDSGSASLVLLHVCLLPFQKLRGTVSTGTASKVTDDVCVLEWHLFCFIHRIDGIDLNIKTYSVPQGRYLLIDHPTLVFEASLE